MTSNADVYDAAKVIAARETVLTELGALAAAPLDEDTLVRMREAIAKATSPSVRAAIRRLTYRPSLRLVAGDLLSPEGEPTEGVA